MLHGVGDATFAPRHLKLQQNRVPSNATETRAEREYVIGTIRQFFATLLPDHAAAEARAVLVHLLVVKSRCFIDGNGRVARLLLNQEIERELCRKCPDGPHLRDRGNLWRGAGRQPRGLADHGHAERAQPEAHAPTLLPIPPFVWHCLQNLENGTGSFINFFDRACCFANPDHWRMPVENDTIPYRFQRV
jgi:hypothetical protein